MEDGPSLSILDNYDSGGGIFDSQLFSGIRNAFPVFDHLFDEFLPSLS